MTEFDLEEKAANELKAEPSELSVAIIPRVVPIARVEPSLRQIGWLVGILGFVDACLYADFQAGAAMGSIFRVLASVFLVLSIFTLVAPFYLATKNYATLYEHRLVVSQGGVERDVALEEIVSIDIRPFQVIPVLGDTNVASYRSKSVLRLLGIAYAYQVKLRDGSFVWVPPAYDQDEFIEALRVQKVKAEITQSCGG